MPTIITKNSSTTTSAPADVDLVEGELAVNTADGTLYVGKATGVSMLVGTGSVTNTGAGADSYRAGTNAGLTTQGANSVAIGNTAGQTDQDASSVAIGNLAGTTEQGYAAIAIGRQAGNNTQANYTVAIGHDAGQTTQGTRSTAIGIDCGTTDQGISAVALGDGCGTTTQGDYAVAIGHDAGNSAQGANAIAIGNGAGKTSQYAESLILNSSGVAVSSGATGQIIIKSSTANIATIAANWYHTGVMTSSSDRRLKQDIEPITGALDKVNALNGVTFDYIDDNSPDRQTGLIAQDVQAVLPEAVSTLPDSEHLGVAYGNVVGLLVEAIKELKAEVDALKGV
jgi:hypothetical protein